MIEAQAAMRCALECALADQGCDVILCRAVPGKTHGIGDLAQGRWSPAFKRVLADILEHTALVVGQQDIVHTY